MKINLVIEHDFSETPDAAAFLESIAHAIANVKRAAALVGVPGYHATNPLIKAEPSPMTAAEVAYDENDNTAPGHEEAKEKRRRRTKAEMEAARAAEAAAANPTPAPSAPIAAAPSTPAAQAPAPAPSSPAPAASPSDAGLDDALKTAINRAVAHLGQPKTMELLAPRPTRSRIPAEQRAAYLEKVNAALKAAGH